MKSKGTSTTAMKKTGKSIKRRKLDKPTGSSPVKLTSSEVAAVTKPKPSKGPLIAAVHHTLILDNGGDTVKYGWSDGSSTTNDTTRCRYMPNLTARLPQQWTVLVGDEVNEKIQNPNLATITRSTERGGIICNLGNQVLVWKRILDVMGVVLPSHSNSSASVLWKNTQWNKTNVNKNNTTTAADSSNPGAAETILSHSCAVLIALPPHHPHNVLEHIMSVWMEDFGFARVGFCLSAVAAAAHLCSSRMLRLESSSTSIPPPPQHEQQQKYANTPTGTIKHKNVSDVIPISCVVDLGYSAIEIVPVYENKVIHGSAIRRVPIGGRHLIQLWKYYCTYRQWNMMDQEWVVRQIWEQTAYVSLKYDQEMKLAQQVAAGRRPYDREFVLPNYDTTQTGTVRIPVAVQRILEKQQHQQDRYDLLEDMNDEEDEDDEDFTEKDVIEDDEDYNLDEFVNDVNESGANIGNILDESDDEEDGDESTENVRKRILKEREEEERRRRELEAEHQILNITVERFAIPETLFRLSDAGLPSEWANVPAAIVQSIEACPLIYQAGLYQSIQLTGGLSQLKNLTERLEGEIRALAPAQYPIKISRADKPQEQAWIGTQQLSIQIPCSDWSIGRDEWEQNESKRCWKRLLMSQGGYLV